MRAAASIPLVPNMFSDSAVILPVPWILDSTSTMPVMSSAEPPVAATASWTEPRMGMTLLAEIPKPSICWVAEMNACLGKGEVLLNALMSSIILVAAAPLPRMVLNAARDVCWRVL